MEILFNSVLLSEIIIINTAGGKMVVNLHSWAEKLKPFGYETGIPGMASREW